METGEACVACGGRLAPDLEWCPRCYARLDPATPPGQAAPEHPPFPFPAMWRDEDPGPPHVYSRWREGTTTFGPVGRVALTLGTVATGVVCWGVFGPPPPFGLGVASSGWLPYLVFAPVTLRAAWRKDRVE